jgi:hypothetical protein
MYTDYGQIKAETYVGYSENLFIIVHSLVEWVNINTKMHGEHKVKKKVNFTFTFTFDLQQQRCENLKCPTPSSET